MATRKKSTRSTALKRAQAEYEAEQRAAGAHVQWNMRMKTAGDRDLVARLQARFPDLSLPAITRLALRELAAKKNRR
ncbi:MAG: hypothetical protein BroJett013_30410 [Alphaproteobacteria bacterium]|nr:MAG: hypothetical protein BroJett013_30410 [Alphaproteobacteria bacterium]